MCQKNLLNLGLEYAEKRCKIPNDHNGKANMSCLILSKNNQYVLRAWDKLLQC